MRDAGCQSPEHLQLLGVQQKALRFFARRRFLSQASRRRGQRVIPGREGALGARPLDLGLPAGPDEVADVGPVDQDELSRPPDRVQGPIGHHIRRELPRTASGKLIRRPLHLA